MAKQNADVLADVNDNFTEVTPEAEAPDAVAQETLGKSYSEEDLKRVREQEKSKLYPQIETLKDELNRLKKAEEEREAEASAARAAAEAEAKRRAEEEMDIRELLRKKEEEFGYQLEAERQEREKAFALLERERMFSELQNYRAMRLEEERDNIIPELIDLITGNTPEEIEQSIAGLKDRSSRILESAAQALTSVRRDMTGSRITAPASGPLDTNSEQQQFTAESIANMSVTEYAKHRAKLLGNAASERGKGLFS